MTNLESKIEARTIAALQELYDLKIDRLELQPTRKEFEGDYTIVVFPYLRSSKKGPEQTATEIGEKLQDGVAEIDRFNVVKGFLNISLSNDFWLEQAKSISSNRQFGEADSTGQTIMVEYSSPNTNKPLHLGHIRNCLLGYSVSEILAAAGNKVLKTQIINDRGIHICKSMVAWQKFGNGETPESSGMKGDHLVGKYYVEFDKQYKKEIAQLVDEGKPKEEAKQQAPIMQEARETLQKWEQGDEEVMELWKKMNHWVYDGFAETYMRLGVDFDKDYYESETYLLGKSVVEEGLEKGIFHRKEDGSVWADLTDEGLDEKLLLRSDGTSVYMTQDLGTAIQRYRDFGINGMIYTVGNEQDYHFKVLFILLKKLGFRWAENLYHLSYGMVDLPTGKMKSREGTVVDADDLISEMEKEAGAIGEELGKTEGMAEEEKKALYHMIGMGALKYYILRVDPRKRMLFNPEESIDFQGNTGPFIQYTHARIKSLLRRGGDVETDWTYSDLKESELNILKQLTRYPQAVQEAADNHAPSVMANYVYDLTKAYNALYQSLPVLTDEDPSAVAFRLQLSEMVASVIKKAMRLLGIDVPERM